MRTVGIIAEYNPFHKVHKYQIEYTKEVLGADYTIVAMSGDFVQRGTPALLPKHVRAEMALRGGADLVLELPVSISCASAEFFASGGVNILDQLGVVDMLCFGCENNSLHLFRETARILTEEPLYYRDELQIALKNGNSFPAARSQALIKYFAHFQPELNIKDLETFFMSPNNILGIEYCKAILRQNSTLVPSPLKREGAKYHELSISDKIFPSASGIRYMLYKNNTSTYSPEQISEIEKSMKNMIPETSMDIFLNGLKSNGSVFESHLDLLLHYRLLEETFESLTEYMDMNEELARRIINTRNQYRDFLQFTQLLKTRELTYTRIQRALLHVLLGIRNVPQNVPYARVLGFRKNAGPLLKEIKKNSRIPFLTKLADAENTLDIYGHTILTENTFASNLYEILVQHQMHQDFRHEYTKPVVII